MKSFSHQLNPALITKSQQLERLTSILQSELPPETCGHYHVAGMGSSTLVIITDSPVWTTRLRQLGPTIIQSLSNKISNKLQHVQIVSRRGSITAPLQTHLTINRVLSKKAGLQVAQAAEYIKDDTLKKALLKFAKRSKKGD